MIRWRLRTNAAERFDLVILGGGIYGACTALEAARRGLKPLLLERDDFGGGTSFNSLRILHGGLRYLQSLDLPRFFESVAERRWFCQHFPELVRPLPCLMPLYGRGLKRPAVLRAALAVNDLLSAGRNRGVADPLHVPNGRVLDPEATAQLYAAADRDRLRGGALWHDAVMLSPQRVLIEILHWAGRLGAVTRNYCEAHALLTGNGRVRGVVAHDRLDDKARTFYADRVINCAGPAGLALARRFGCETPSELWYPSLAANVLVDRTPPASVALALADNRPGGRVYFMYPRGGHLYAGTAHFPRAEGETDPSPTDRELHEMLDGLNAAAPSLRLRPEDVLRVHSGLLPVNRPGTTNLTARETIHAHGRSGGPAGFFTIRGIKYTTARRVAERALRAAFPRRWDRLNYRPGTARKPCTPALDLNQPEQMLAADTDWLRPEILRLMHDEAAVCTQDLVYRRTDWAGDPRTERAVLDRLHEAVPLLRHADARPPAQEGHGHDPSAPSADHGASRRQDVNPSQQRQGEAR